MDPTITAEFTDGPLKGTTAAADVVEGRPPKTVDQMAPGGEVCRYCLAEWAQGGPSAAYTFLYVV